MNGDNRGGPGRNQRLKLIRIEIERPGVDVREYRTSARSADGAARGNERKRRDNDFVSRLHAASMQPELERLRTRRDSNRIAHAASLDDFTLQRLSLRSQDELLRGQNLFDGGANLGGDRLELRAQVEHGYYFYRSVLRHRHQVHNFSAGILR